LELYKANRGLLHRLARRYAAIDTAADIEDLMQAGYLGLVEAERTYGADEGTWYAWAALHVRRAMREAVGIGSTRKREAGTPGRCVAG
jgi:DNA-directed RNA polymerase specialized sigma subunit